MLYAEKHAASFFLCSDWSMIFASIAYFLCADLILVNFMFVLLLPQADQVVCIVLDSANVNANFRDEGSVCIVDASNYSTKWQVWCGWDIDCIRFIQ